MLGDEIDIDGERDLIGMIRHAKDSQRMYNYWTSAATEAVALAPKAPFIAAHGQLEGFEHIWERANSQNFAYLPYNPVSANGTLVGAPQRNQAEPPISAMMAIKQQAAEDIKATTGIYDASLGARSNETSGKAIIARQHEGDTGNFHFIDNLSRSLRHLGLILVDLIPKIYDTQRVVRILEPNGDARSVTINAPFEEKGVMKLYDLSAAKFDISVQTGPSYATRRIQAAESMAQILQGNPQLWQVAGDILARNLDWPGADELAERMKKMLPPQLQEKEEGGQKMPPEVQQKIEQMGQMIEQLTQALNQAHDEKDKEADKLRSQEFIALERNRTDITKQIIQTEGTNRVAVLQAELDHNRQAQAMSQVRYEQEEAGENNI